MRDDYRIQRRKKILEFQLTAWDGCLVFEQEPQGQSHLRHVQFCPGYQRKRKSVLKCHPSSRLAKKGLLLGLAGCWGQSNKHVHHVQDSIVMLGSKESVEFSPGPVLAQKENESQVACLFLFSCFAFPWDLGCLEQGNTQKEIVCP